MAEATHISAVSGANYIVSAMYVTAAESEGPSLDDSPPWSAGSPEEGWLRNNTDYLAPGPLGRVWLAANLVYGAFLNYVPIALGSFLLGRLMGWFLAWVSPALRSRGHIGKLPDLSGAFLLSLGLVLVLTVAVIEERRGERRSRTSAQARKAIARQRRYRAISLVLTLGITIGALVPMVILATRHLAYIGVGITTGDIRLGTASSDLPSGLNVYIALGATLSILVLLGGLTVALSRRRAHSVLLPALSSIAGFGLLIVPFAGSASYGAIDGLNRPGAIIVPLVAGAVLLFFGLFVHNAHYSMHLYYRQRLAWAFAVRRITRITRSGFEFKAKNMPYEKALDFLQTVATAREKCPHLPEPIVCAAVNLTDRNLPIGRNVASFVFRPTTSGGPDIGRVRTEELAMRLAGRVTPLTYPTLMAVSGAALSPVMGRFTQNSLRLLMALMNVRLGIWIPNPSREAVRLARETARRRALRERSSRWPQLRRLSWRVVDGWREPGALYVLREGLGILDRQSRYVYITDGGHWDNLGLVEVVRAGCRDIVCFDASTDALGGLAALGQAASLLRTELGLELDVNVSALSPDEEGLCDDVVAIGRLLDSEGTVVGRVTVVRAAMTRSSSIDIAEFRKREPRFPAHSTADQFYRDDRFEAYRALGRAAARRAVAARGLDKAAAAAQPA